MPPRKKQSKPTAKTRTPRAKKAESLPPLTDFPPEQVVPALARCAHFTGKGVNSVIPPTGVRLGPAGVPRPTRPATPRFVSARGMVADTGGPAALSLDGLQGGAAAWDAKIARQVAAVLGGTRADAPAALIDHYRRAAEEVTSRTVTLGGACLDPRLRQLLLPWQRKAGEAAYVYLAATPLSAGAMALRLQAAVQAAKSLAIAEAKERRDGARAADAPRRPWPVMGVVPVGGSKPQNVGIMAYAQSAAWIQPAPNQTPHFRAALALHHGALRLPVLYGVARRLAHAWARGGSAFEVHRRLVPAAQAAARRVLEAGDAAAQRLRDHGFSEGDGRWPTLSPEVDKGSAVRAWIGARHAPRDAPWARGMADRAMKQLQGYTRREGAVILRVLPAALLADAREVIVDAMVGVLLAGPAGSVR